MVRGAREHVRLYSWENARSDLFAGALRGILRNEMPRLVRFFGGSVVKSHEDDLESRIGGLLENYGNQVIRDATPLSGGFRPARSEIEQLQAWGEWRDRFAQSLSSRVRRSVLSLVDDELRRDPTGDVLRRVIDRAGEELVDGPGAIMASRNAIATATSVGQDIAYDQRGVEVVQWLAFQAPKWPRRHDLLDGEMRFRGEMFDMPRSSHQLRHPHDPRGHVSETINCRCSRRPIVKGTSEYDQFIERNGGGDNAPPTRSDLLDEIRSAARETPRPPSGEARHAETGLWWDSGPDDTVLVRLDLRAVDRALSQTPALYAGPTGTGDRGLVPEIEALFRRAARYGGFSITAPIIGFLVGGTIGAEMMSIQERHQIEALRRMGVDELIARVHPSDRDEILRLFGRRRI